MDWKLDNFRILVEIPASDLNFKAALSRANRLELTDAKKFIARNPKGKKK